MAEAKGRGRGSVTAELRSVNHRFCEIVVRLPRVMSSLEDEFKRTIQQHCARGRIELSVSLSGGKETGKQLSLDHALARQYHSLLRDLKKKLRLSGSIDVAMLTGYRDIISVSDRPVDDKPLIRKAKQVVEEALSALDQMRRREGAVLAKDLSMRVHTVRTEIAAIEQRSPHVVQEYFSRLKARVDKLAASADLDQGRLAQELALYAERCDITEEVTRLGSHLGQFENIFHQQGARRPYTGFSPAGMRTGGQYDRIQSERRRNCHARRQVERGIGKDPGAGSEYRMSRCESRA